MATDTPAFYSLADLAAAGRDLPDFPVTIQLGQDTLQLNECLRLVPGKRLVARATWGQDTVLAKLFFQRHGFTREQQSYPLLADSAAHTPACIGHFPLDAGGVTLYHFLTDAVPLDQAWPDANEEQRQQLLKRVLDSVSLGYHAGIGQADLHLGNFLLQDNTLYALDPAGYEPCLTPEDRLKNLSLFIAQLPFPQWEIVANVIYHRFTETGYDLLLEAAQLHWRKRLHAYLDKVFRDCTDIADLSTPGRRVLCRRDRLTPALAAALADPATAAQHATVLKEGGSATVFRCDIDGRAYVFKRYRHKDRWRAVRRWGRPSRAARSWRMAHALQFATIVTPTPIALIEHGRWGHIPDAWFVTEAVHGEDLLQHWQRREPTAGQIAKMKHLFHTLALAGICHGDMKATNLLVQGDEIYLIDLDAAREVRGGTLDAALHEDRLRFLRNWEGRTFLPELREATRT